MKMRTVFALAALASMLSSPLAGRAQDATQPLDKSLQGIKFGIVAYLDYSEGSLPLPNGEQVYYNRFALTRGYLTVEKTINPMLGARMTVDIHQDKSDTVTVGGSSAKVPNDLEGSYVVRIKYLYATIKPEDLGPFTHMKVELGMGHTPWLDFEQKINPYRCQGKMAIERPGVLSSADAGVSLQGYLGEPLDDAKGKTGNSKYAGRFGSWHIGVYNGGGYSASENNQNKVVEGRISLRPLPDFAPGLQFSYFYLTGDGNKSYQFNNDTYWPYYQAQIGMMSLEHPAFAFTAQRFTTQGNAKGTWVRNGKGDSIMTEGYSGFLRLAVPGTENKLNLFGRYDHFDIDPEDRLTDDGKTAYAMTIYGVAYDIDHGNLFMVVYETTDYERDADTKGKLPVMDNDLGNEDKLQAVYQIKF